MERRLKEHQTCKRRSVVLMREQNGLSMPIVFPREGDAAPTIAARGAIGSTVYADEGSGWDELHARFAMKRVNHSVRFVDEDCCTNQAESYFSRLRRAEVGTHHHISGPYLGSYANEMAWREDNRRVSNGDLYMLVAGAALAHSVSRQWKGYWQRSMTK